MTKLPSITLRPGDPGEVEDLVRLATTAYATSIGKLPDFAVREADIHVAFTRFITDDLDQIIVAEQQGTLLGFAATEGQSDEISDVWVDPIHQGKGVGAILLSACEAQIKQWGFSCCWLTTHAHNTRASNFYRIQGYTLLNVHTAPSVSLPGINYPKALLGKQLSRPNAAKADSMAEVRVGIDTLDPMIVSLLAERFAFIDRAADLKPALAMPARVHERVEEVVANARAQAEGIGFDPDLTEKLWRTMIDLAIDREDHKMGAPTHERAS